MSSAPETSGSHEPVLPIEQRLLAQNEGLKTALLKALLEANGYRPARLFYTWRGIYEDKQVPQKPFSLDYEPTLAQIFDKSVGHNNWTVVRTGRVLDRPDPEGDTPPETLRWKNSEYEIYTREPGNVNPDFTDAYDIHKSIAEEFPPISLGETQSQ